MLDDGGPASHIEEMLHYAGTVVRLCPAREWTTSDLIALSFSLSVASKHSRYHALPRLILMILRSKYLPLDP